MRPHIEDVLDVLREIRSVDSEGKSGRSVMDLRLRAVQKVAKAELAKGRYKNWDSAEKTIHEACTRRLQKTLSAKGFDALVKNWLSGQPEGLQSLLRRAYGYSKNEAEVEALLHARVPGEHSVVPDGEGTSYSASAVLKANDIVDAVHPERRETIVQRIIRDTETNGTSAQATPSKPMSDLRSCYPSVGWLDVRGSSPHQASWSSTQWSRYAEQHDYSLSESPCSM